jgi:glycine oxidase
VAVIGGGAIGLAVAWEARCHGLEVALFDRDALGQGASHVAAGMLAPASEVEFGDAGRRLLELGLASLARWPQFAQRLTEQSGIDPGLRSAGTLFVARDRDQAEALERELSFRRRRGLDVHRLLASEARRLEPALAPTLRLALELAEDRSVDPRPLTEGLAVAAERAGAVLSPGTRVVRVLVDRGAARVVGVELAGGERVLARSVVIAAGAWSGHLPGLPEEAALPVRPVKGQILRLRDLSGPGLLERVIRFEGGYLVPRGDGRYVLGATVEERGFDTAVTAGGLWELLDAAGAVVPGVWELAVEECSAGLRPGTPDNVPAIGPGALEGLVWATGHYRNGILLIPITVELVMAALGAASGSPLALSCAPARFAAGASGSSTNARSPAKGEMGPRGRASTSAEHAIGSKIDSVVR